MTYSVVARDASTGALGVAVQSHWFAVGSVVPWASPGVGAVATQAAVETSYGPRALELLAGGATPAQAVSRLLADDPAAASRQLAVVDARGQSATHTGASCIPQAGHVTGAGVSCQANIMASAQVWPAMLNAYERGDGGLAERLLAALDAGEREGGDLRGRQSAAILVVPPHGERWESSVSLRVDDHPSPLHELRRLLEAHRAYAIAEEADELAATGQHTEAAASYLQASELAPENLELRFWAGLGAAQVGDMTTALELVRSVIAAHPGWAELLARLPAEVAPSAQALLAQLRG